MIRAKFICSMALMLILRICNGQITQARDFIPQILPASPEAASYTKFGNYDVNLFTGLPDIHIPLYEIKIGELSLPISISYHPSGIKVNDWGSWIGTGWNLNAGASISRKVMGRPDEQTGNYLSGQTVKDVSTLNLNTQADLDYIRLVSNGSYDAEPDIFSYSLPGKNGKFVFNQANNFKPIMIPYDPIVVSFANNFFDITDERGVLYQFHNAEYTNTSAGTNSQGNSTWVITQMLSANKQDTISFSYASRNGQVSEDIRDFIVLNDAPYNAPQYNVYSSDYGNGYSDDIITGVAEKKIQQILFPNGKIVFDASGADRADAYTGQKSLQDIKLYSLNKKSGNYTLIKSVNFYQSYFIKSNDNTVKRLRLDSLSVNDSSGAVIDKYRFNYNTSIDLPNRLSRERDYWGYYNGKDNNTMVPQITQVAWQGQSNSQPSTITIGSNIANGRDPDSSYMQAYMLQRIYYPTGGYTDFEYETNKYLQLPSTIKYAGGLRIKTIKSYDGINPNPVEKSYKYGGNESGYGRANFILKNYFFQTTQNNQYFIEPSGCRLVVGTKRVRTFISNPNIEIEPYDGAPVVYDSVTEYIGDGTTNIGKTIYVFNDHADGLNTTVTTGKPVLTTYYENRGQLIDKLVYKNSGNNIYQLAEETKNTFTAYPEQFYYNLGLVAFKTKISDDQNAGSDIALPAYDNKGACFYNDSQNYTYANYAIRTDDNKLKQSINYAYDQNNPSMAVITKTNYYYDNPANLQVTRIYTVNSLGDSIKVYKKYPADFSSAAPYNTMIGLNIINKVVQEQKFKNTTQLTSQTNNYVNAGNGNYLPDSITYQVAANPVETMVYFNYYDNRGNILEMQKANDVKQSYVWDYQKIYPVAEVVNAGQNQVAYTSFEADGAGNWTISSSARDSTTTALTGSRSYNMAAGSISKSGLSSGKTYIVSYWSRAGACSFSGGTVTTRTGRWVNGWTYYEHTLTAASSTITFSGSANIDELRLYPQGAQMKSYTYAPLVGMTSSDDPNGEITYYEYDGLQRLKNVKDYQGNIIKNFQYNYANSCGPACSVLPMQTFNATNTLSYPVGVFNISGKLLGNAANQSQYISAWMADTADAHTGTIVAGDDSMHFKFTVNPGRIVPPSLTGCRYYQYDMAYDQLDAVRNLNGSYVDFGDGTEMRLGKTLGDTTIAIEPHTTVNYTYSNFYQSPEVYWIHNYPDSSQKTITIYHNDGTEQITLDNYFSPAPSLNRVKNLRGNIPQHIWLLATSCFQQASALTFSSVPNWNSINSVTHYQVWMGDGTSAALHMSYAQDFMANNRNLQKIITSDGLYREGYEDITFKISRLKTDWNEYFSNLQLISICDDHWNKEDLSGLRQLKEFDIYAGNQQHSIYSAGNPLVPILQSVIDNILIQIAAGAGTNISNGRIIIGSGGTVRSPASDSAVSLLKSKGWTILVNNVQL